MITNDTELSQAVEQLDRMYRALAALRREVFPLNPRQFALLAEGPQDEISRLQQAIDAYTGRISLAELQADVWLRLKGRGMAWPDAPTSVLTAYLDAFRKGVQTVVEFDQAGHLATRPTKELKNACDLQVAALMPGSLCIGIRVPDGIQLDLSDSAEPHPVMRALKQFLAVAGWIASDSPPEALQQLITDAQKRRLLLNAIKPFVPRPRGDVESVEVSGRIVPAGNVIRLTRQSHHRINTAIDQIAAEQVETHSGDLREIDLDGLSFILRNAEDVHEVRCVFEEDLLETAKEALDRRVQVTGSRRVEPGRRASPALRVIRLEILEEDAGESPSGMEAE
jgi:hypothetical protein